MEKSTNIFHGEILKIFMKCLSQDETFIYTFDFSKLMPELVFKVLTSHEIKKSSLSIFIPKLQNDSPLLARLAAYVKELDKEKLDDGIFG